MIARIKSIDDSFEDYVVCKESECRDDVDLSAYRACMQHNDVITMGKVIVSPVNRKKIIKEIIEHDMEILEATLTLMSNQELQEEYEERFK